jgi:ribonuclease HI
MLVLQHNCRKSYAVTIAALELGLQRGADVVCLQEPYIARDFRHGGYLLYWPEKGDRKDARVNIAVRRDLLDKIVVETRGDLLDHPYIMAVDIWDLSRAQARVRRTRVVNCYDNWLGAEYCWQGGSARNRRAIEDVQWSRVIEGRCMVLGDFNAHSPLWNPHSGTRANAGPLEAIIERYELCINNTPGESTRPKSTPGISIIDLTLTSPEMGPLPLWSIDSDHPTGSDHEVIVTEWEDLASQSGGEVLGETSGEDPKAPTITGWKIQALQDNPEALDKAKQAWEALAYDRPALTDACTKEDVDEEALWIENSLTMVLSRHAKPTRLSPYSKRWWGEKIQKARNQYARARRAWRAGGVGDEDHCEARNSYYRTIRKAKRECWEAFLGGPQEVRDRLGPEDTTRCWQALRYTSPKTSDTTPTLRTAEGRTATTVDEKEALILETMFPPAPDGAQHYDPPLGTMHKGVNEGTVRGALFSQATRKSPGVDRLNFKALRLLWGWDSARIVALARQCLRLGAHPHAWKTAKGIILRKPNKLRSQWGLVRSYRVISLLNCMGKVVEKLVAEAIAEHCEATGALHQGQMGGRRRRSAVDAVACLIQDVHLGWGQKKLAAALFLDVKGAFDHVDPARLTRRMGELGIDGDLIRWTQSFLTGRRVRLVIDGHQGMEYSIRSGVPQGSPVSPILFAIYLSGIFGDIEQAVPGVRALSFADDIGILALGSSVDQVCERLQQAGQAAIAWGQDNAVQFDEDKTEAALFTRKRGRQLREQVKKARIVIGAKRVPFNKEATRWLGILLDHGLTLKTHYHSRLQKARNAEARIKALCRQQGLAAGLARRMQIAAVQSVALYGAELWWQGQKDRSQNIQRLVNRQARAITGMFSTTPVGPLIKEAALTPAEALLDDRQLRYTTRLLGLPRGQPTKQVLPVTLREGDRHAQPGEQPANDRKWAEAHARGFQSLGQHLARQLAMALPVDPSGGFEEVETEATDTFPGQILVLPREEAIKAAQEGRSAGLTIWSDGSRLENGRVGAGLAWQTRLGSWKTREVPMGIGHETFDAELEGACTALEIALKGRDEGPVTILLDSLAAIKRLQVQKMSPGQGLVVRAHRAAQALEDRGRRVTVQWVPGHSGIEGNERADQVAKSAAAKSRGNDQGISIAYTNRVCTEVVKARRQQWLSKMLGNGDRAARGHYRAQRGWKQDPILAAAPKKLASRFYQLKSGHAAIGPYLQRIEARDSKRCQGCQAPEESVRHLLLECREWRRPREKMLKALRKAGVDAPAAVDTPEKRLLGNPRATKAILGFLAETTVACPQGGEREAARIQRDDEWGLGALVEAERAGEG